MYDGTKIQDNDTPKTHDMEDNDTIEVHIEQVRFPIALLRLHATLIRHPCDQVGGQQA